MATEVTTTEAAPDSAETGSFRRSLVRRIAVCLAAGALLMASSAAGWFLHVALHPPGAAIRPESSDADTAGTESQTDRYGDAENLLHDANGPESNKAKSTSASRGRTGDPHLHEQTDSGRQAADETPMALSSADSRSSQASRALLRESAAGLTLEEIERAAAAGEQYLIEGEPAKALREFDLIADNQDRTGDERFHYHCGLCCEALGQFERALSEYGLALSAASDETLIALCRLGQARVWRAIGHVDMARLMLAPVWLTNDHPDRAPPARPFAAYLLADALVSECMAETAAESTDDSGLLLPRWEFDILEQSLMRTAPNRKAESGRVLSGVQVIAVKTGDSLDVELQCRLNRMSLTNLIDALCRAAGIRTTWTPTARQAVSGRTAEICLSRARLPMCLDALTATVEVVWVPGNREIRLLARSEADRSILEAYHRAAARRALEHAVEQHPDFRLCPYALVALGNLCFQEQRFADAERYYKEMVSTYPRSVARSDASFNLGKLYLRHNRPDPALESFWRVVDGGAPPATASAAYLYIGRLLLDAEQPRRAISPLIRATQLATESTVRTRSVLSLAAAYLLYGNPKGANEVLMDFRSDVESQELQGSFLSALARYRVASSRSQRLYDGEALLSAADTVRSEDFFGRYGWYLRGSAYQELLLPEVAAQVYEAALNADRPLPYRDAMAYGLGVCLSETGEPAQAAARFEEVMQYAGPQWRRRAAFRLCQLQLDTRQPQTAVRTARTLVDECTVQADKARAMQLLGAAYQQLGDHQSAALCFAGSLPGATSSADGKEP